jgi:CheY-like chemotaxis protein
MRIFILEDDTERRTPVFRANLIGHELVFAETAAQAIKILGMREFDLIFLDHDLGGQQWVDPNDKNTGSEVTRWMVEEMSKCPTVIIHSLNSPAAQAMKHRLLNNGFDAHYIPWIDLKHQLGKPGFITVQPNEP